MSIERLKQEFCAQDYGTKLIVHLGGVSTEVAVKVAGEWQIRPAGLEMLGIGPDVPAPFTLSKSVTKRLPGARGEA